MAHPNDTLTDAKILLLAEQHLYSSTNIFGTLNFARAIVNALAIDAAPPAKDEPSESTSPIALDAPSPASSGFTPEQILALAKLASTPDETTDSVRPVTLYAAKTGRFLERFAIIIQQDMQQRIDARVEPPEAITPDKTILELLDELDLSVRLRNSLLAELSNSEHASPLNVNSPASEFLKLTREELLCWPNIGRKALNELEAKIKESQLPHPKGWSLQGSNAE